MADKEDYAHLNEEGNVTDDVTDNDAKDDDNDDDESDEEETDLDETYDPDELPVSFRVDSGVDSRLQDKRKRKVRSYTNDWCALLCLNVHNYAVVMQ